MRTGFKACVALAGMIGVCLVGIVTPVQAQISVEDQFESIASSLPLPYDTPMFIIDALRADGKTLHRTLRLKGKLENMSDAAFRIAADNHKKEQIAVVCKSAFFKTIMVQGAAFEDDVRFVDGTEFLKVRIDAAACSSQPEHADFSGPDRVSPTIAARISEIVKASHAPVSIGLGQIVRFTANGRRLTRQIVMSYENVEAELRHGGRDTWIGVQCKQAHLAQMILDGAEFEDRLVTVTGEEIDVIVANRTSCRRVLQGN